MRGFLAIAVCLCITATANARDFSPAELRWASAIASGQKQSTRLPYRVRQGGGQGIRVGLRGVSATRVRFKSEADAQAFGAKVLDTSSLTVVEIRGRQAVVLRGKPLENEERARRMLEDAWGTLPGSGDVRHLLLVARNAEEVAALVDTPEGPFQERLDALVEEAQVQLVGNDPTIALAQIEETYALQKGRDTFAVFRQSGLTAGVVASAETLESLETLCGLLEALADAPLNLRSALTHLKNNPIPEDVLAEAERKQREAEQISVMETGKTLRAGIGGGRLDLTGTWTTAEGDRVGFSNRRLGRWYDTYDLTVARPNGAIELTGRFNGAYLDTVVLGFVEGRRPDAVVQAPPPEQPRRRGLIGGLSRESNVIGGGRYEFNVAARQLELKALNPSTRPSAFVQVPVEGGGTRQR